MKYLYLSHWNDAMEVQVDSNLMQNMKNHHFLGVRFLYNVYKKKFKGAILNYDQGMNYPWIFQIFLSAIFKYHEVKSPILILTPPHDIFVWHYHMKQTGVQLILLNDKNCKEVFENCDTSIILASLNDLNIIHPHRDKKFEFVIVDHFDSVAYKMIFKKLSGNFNIALTNKDFMVERNQKLLWTMLNWTNPQLFGKLADFYKKDTEHLQNLRDPYDEVWHRLSWNFCESFVKETEEELEAYKKTIDDWKTANKMIKSETNLQQKAGKRKLQKPEKNSKSNKGKTKKRQNHSSLTAAKTQQNTVIEESQNGFESIFDNKNQKNITCSLKNYSKLPKVQILKSASKANKKKYNRQRVHNKNSGQAFTESLKCSTGNKNTESLESYTYEKQWNLSQVGYRNNKQMDNKSLLETDLYREPEKLKWDCHNNNKETENKLSNIHREDKITQTDLQPLEETNDNFTDDAKVDAVNIASNEKPIDNDDNDDEIPLLTDVTEGSTLKDVASQDIENSNTNTSSDAEESDILLSIIEGKFSASQDEFNIPENKEAIASSINKNNTNKFSKSNSQYILTSLFGNEAEYVENLETPKRKLQFIEDICLNQENSFSRPVLIFNECASPIKCASEDYYFSQTSNENKDGQRKSKYETHVVESLFNFEEDVSDCKTLKEDMYKLSDEERNTLITSLFGD